MLEPLFFEEKPEGRPIFQFVGEAALLAYAAILKVPPDELRSKVAAISTLDVYENGRAEVAVQFKQPVDYIRIDVEVK